MTDSLESFVNLVADMREQQKLYFATRSTDVLTKSKQLERAVDAEIKRLLHPDRQKNLEM